MSEHDDGPDPTRHPSDARPGVDRGDGGPDLGAAETRVGPWGRRVTSRVAWIVAGLMTLVAGAAIYVHPTGNEGQSQAATPGRALLGMSAPAGTWAQRVNEVGPGLQARRIFVSSFTGSLSLASTACNAGMSPIISFKTGSYSWAQVAAGNADSQLQALHAKLVALPCAVYVAVHHEPSSDGTASDFTRMQVHALPILGGTIADPEVKVGVIGNGWWFNTNSQGYSDAVMDQWVGPAVRAVSDFIAADTYQGKATAESVASKINRMGAWANRVNAKTPTAPVRALGQGEWNTQTAQGITDVCNAVKANPLIAFSSVWNNNGTGSANAHVLVGASLTAFKNCLANW